MDKSLLGQKSPWTKVSLDNCLLGQMSPWTIVSLYKNLLGQKSPWTPSDKRLIGQLPLGQLSQHRITGIFTPLNNCLLDNRPLDDRHNTRYTCPFQKKLYGIYAYKFSYNWMTNIIGLCFQLFKSRILSLIFDWLLWYFSFITLLANQLWIMLTEVFFKTVLLFFSI